MADYNAYPAGYFLGNVETFVVTAEADIESNMLVTAGRLRGVTRQKFKNGDKTVVFLNGKMAHYNFELATTGIAISQGTEIYITSEGKATTTATDNTLVGCLYQAVLSTDTYADVLVYPPAPSNNTGLTTEDVTAMISAAIATHATLTAGNSEGNVHPGPAVE